MKWNVTIGSCVDCDYVEAFAILEALEITSSLNITEETILTNLKRIVEDINEENTQSTHGPIIALIWNYTQR